jgi:hypothetical protein
VRQAIRTARAVRVDRSRRLIVGGEAATSTSGDWHEVATTGTRVVGARGSPAPGYRCDGA